MGELYQRSEIEHTKRNSVQYNYLIDQNLGDVGHCYIVLVYNAALEGGGGGVRGMALNQYFILI